MILSNFGFGSGGGGASGDISGAGTAPKMPKFTAEKTIADSQVSDNGTTVFIGASATSEKALFELNSTTQGVLLPRLTTAQINAISVNAAANSLTVFDTDISKFKYYDHSSTSWKIIESSTIGGETLESVLSNGNTTGANDIIVSANQAIKAPTSGTALRGSLNLRDGGDGIVTLTNDNGVQVDSGIYMENLYQANFIDGWNAAVEIKSGLGTGYIYDVYTSKLLLLISDDFSVPTAPGLHISDTFGNQIDNTANSVLNSRPVAFLANRNSSANLGVQGSVALGGQNITMKNDNVAYANTFGFSIPTFGGPFDLLLQPAIISADRTQIFQDADGTIALLSDLSPYLKLDGTTPMKGNLDMTSNAVAVITKKIQTNDGILDLLYGSDILKLDFSAIGAGIGSYLQTWRAKAGTVAHLDDIPKHSYMFAASDETSDLGADATTSVYTDYIAVPITPTSVMTNVNTAPTGAKIIVDIKKNGTSIFSTLISIDTTENTSLTASVPYVLNGTEAFVQGDKIECFITQVGSAIAGAGLKVKLIA